MRLSPLLLVCLAAAGPAWGWGEAGHRIVGELAERQLTPPARVAVAQLLRDEPDPTLAGVAVWADQVREREEYAHTRPWHFVNFRDFECRYAAARDCPGGQCAIGAIQRLSEVLGDPDYTRQQRSEALKFVVHFVGDVHQPLHAGLREDLGGNHYQVSHAGQGWNLHSVWDSLILRGGGRDWRAYADALAARPPLPPDPAAGSDHPPRDWAIESCRAITDRGIYPERGRHTIDQGYLDRHRPFAEQRLRQAANRLADLLNRALGP